ncbi:hypothetical protein Tco_0327509 [Tanacetum coccineum]
MTNDSSGGYADGKDEDDEDEEEEEKEHLAPADSVIVVPVDEPGQKSKVERLLARTNSITITTYPQYHHPLARERLIRALAPPPHSSSPPVQSPLLPSSGCPTQIQTLKIASTQALIDAVTAASPSPPLPPSLYIPPPVDHRDDIPESEQPPRKRLCLSTLGSRYEVGESSTARPTKDRGIDYGFVSTIDAKERRQGTRDVGYGIRDTWVDPAGTVPKIAPMTVGESRIHPPQHRYGSPCGLIYLWDRNELSKEQYWMVERRGLCFPEAWSHIEEDWSQATSSGASDPFVIHLLTIRRQASDEQHRKQTAKTMRLGFRSPSASGDAQTTTSAALTWWNGQIRTLGPEVYAMTWEILKKKMMDKYCQGEIKKLEIELWNLKVKGNDVPAYTEREKEALWGIFAQVHQVPSSPQWPVYPEVPQVQQSRAFCSAIVEYRIDKCLLILQRQWQLQGKWFD